MSDRPPFAPKPFAIGDVLAGRGTVTSHVGLRRGKEHQGVDIAAAKGTPIKARFGGKVVRADNKDANGYGYQVVIESGVGRQERYAHMNPPLIVRWGQEVRAGEIIGYVGNSGRSRGKNGGYHLHYEELRGGRATNPFNGQVHGVARGIRGSAQAHVHATEGHHEQHGADNNQGSYIGGKFVKPTARNQYQASYDEAAVIGALTSGSIYQPNSLNDYENVSYHWRLFASSDVDYLTQVDNPTSINDFYQVLSEHEQITIAETAMTRFNIDSVTMEATVGPDFQSRSTKFTKIVMKVTEPNSARFLDALRESAINSGVRNYLKCQYYLELTFKGYDLEGNIVTKINPSTTSLNGTLEEQPNGGRWLWGVQITNIEVNVQAGGGTYTVEMLPIGDTGLAPEYGTLLSPLTPAGATVNEMLERFATGLNLQWAENLAGRNIVVHDFQVHGVGDLSTDDLMTSEEVLSMETGVLSEIDPSIMASMAFDDNGAPKASILRGARIQDFINAMMGSCGKVTELAQNEKIIWRVEPDVRMPDYDPIIGMYHHHITWHIFGFRQHTTVIDLDEAQEAIDEERGPPKQRQLLLDLAKRNFLRKRYDFIFTGLNTEVIDIDLNFNISWSAVLPSITHPTKSSGAISPSGLTADSGGKFNFSHDPAKLTPPADGIEGDKEFFEGLPQRVSQATNAFVLHQSLVADLQRLRKEKEEVKQQQRNRKLENPTDANEQIKAENAKLRSIAAREQAIVSYTLQTTGVVNAQRARAYQETKIPERNSERSFADDIPIGVQRSNRLPQVHPVSFMVAGDEPTAHSLGGFDDGSQKLSLYGAILNQAYGVQTAQFQHIQMTIRGDPFWIGPGNFEEMIAKRSGQYNPAQTIDFSHGANTFMFRVKYPTDTDDLGSPVTSGDEAVTGVFQVNKITHKFENGQFTQTLDATRLPLLDVYVAIRSVEGETSAEGQNSPADQKASAANAEKIDQAPNVTGPEQAKMEERVRQLNASPQDIVRPTLLADLGQTTPQVIQDIAQKRDA